MSLGKECLEIMRRLFLGELNPKQYCDGLIALHIKYPLGGHNPPLNTFQLKNYRKLLIQPLNFNEAAQMYYWQTKDKQDCLKPEAKSWYKED